MLCDVETLNRFAFLLIRIMAAKLAFLFLLFGAISISLVHGKQPHRKVLILGAGLSGIVAGKTLQDNGIDDFLILEGQDYIGGRIKKKSFSGFTIEEGANWIQAYNDEESAPLRKLKKDQDLKGKFSDYGSVIIRNETGAKVTDNADFRHIEKAFEGVEAKQEERKKAKMAPLSARDGLALLGWNPKTAAQYVIEYYNVDFQYGKKAERVPFGALEWTSDDDPVDYFSTDQKGLFSIYEDIERSVLNRTKLKTTVTGIKYNSSVVEVTTQNGETYTADFVLCTFSTGVLASDMVKFSPPLPEWKKDAILKMPMSVYTNIYLKFPKKFWDDKEYILLAAQNRGYFPIFQNLDKTGFFPGSGLLLIIVTGDEGRRIEKQSFNETKNEIVKMLKGVYGQNISEPTEMFYARWSLNPFVRGSFSEGTVDRSEKNVADLGKNVGNLYFAGEATDADWYGLQQGAYRTGAGKATTIAKAIKCRETGKECPPTESSTNRLNPSIIVIFAAVLAWMSHNI